MPKSFSKWTSWKWLVSSESLAIPGEEEPLVIPGVIVTSPSEEPTPFHIATILHAAEVKAKEASLILDTQNCSIAITPLCQTHST